MAKRFVDTDRDRVTMRGVDVKTRFAFEWLWKNCDAAGIWKMDLELFKFECGYKLDVQGLLKSCPRVEMLPCGSLFLTDFIEVNYGSLKPDYNPHKPVFRSLSAHGIDPVTLKAPRLAQGLPNPCPRVEEEEEGEEEEISGKERARETRADVWPTFDDWWDAYGKKVDRPKCEAKWRRMNQADREAAFRHTEAYVLATPDVTYRRNPATYLNNQNWNDEELTRQRTTGGSVIDLDAKRRLVLEEVAKHHAAYGGTGQQP